MVAAAPAGPRKHRLGAQSGDPPPTPEVRAPSQAPPEQRHRPSLRTGVTTPSTATGGSSSACHFREDPKPPREVVKSLPGNTTPCCFQGCCAWPGGRTGPRGPERPWAPGPLPREALTLARPRPFGGAAGSGRGRGAKKGRERGQAPEAGAAPLRAVWAVGPLRRHPVVLRPSATPPPKPGTQTRGFSWQPPS